MPNREPVPVVGIVDNVDPDNPAQVLTLMAPDFDLKGVIVTGRAANDNRDAALDDISPADSAFRTTLNAVRMLNFMDEARQGHGIPVFVGSPAPHTLVPHRLHVDELAFDDLKPGQLSAIRRRERVTRLGLAGDMRDSDDFLRSGEVDEFALIVGGPMTDVAKLLRNPDISEKAVALFAQFGMFGFGERQLMDFGETAPRGRRQFNVACDPGAANEVLMTFRGQTHLYPTDVTRVDAIGFEDNRALHEFLPENRGTQALVRLYDIGYELMVKPRGEMIYMHDIAPALGCLGVHGAITDPYEEQAVDIARIPHEAHEAARFGEIDLSFDPANTGSKQYVAVDVDARRYLAAVKNIMTHT